MRYIIPCCRASREKELCHKGSKFVLPPLKLLFLSSSGNRTHCALQRLLLHARHHHSTFFSLLSVEHHPPWLAGKFAPIRACCLGLWNAKKTGFGLKSLLVDGVLMLRTSMESPPGNGATPQSCSPWHRFRGKLKPSPERVVLGLIAVNVAVFMLWQNADPGFMMENFMVQVQFFNAIAATYTYFTPFFLEYAISVRLMLLTRMLVQQISLDNFLKGRVHTLITCAFSHYDPSHLGSNMFSLYFFGRRIGREFGTQFLVKLYLAGALGGSIFFLLHKGIMLQYSEGNRREENLRAPVLGASPAVNAIILLWTFLFPKNKVYLLIVIPVPAALMGALFIGTDLQSIEGRGSSGSSHLGGAMVAALVWARITKRWI